MDLKLPTLSKLPLEIQGVEQTLLGNEPSKELTQLIQCALQQPIDSKTMNSVLYLGGISSL